jgi:RNA polymerase sigma-70 factor (ECF subfamily)
MDEVLIRRAQGGDHAALERLLADLMPRVRRWARTHVEDGDDADDVAQMTLINVAKGLPRFDLRANLDTWLHPILRRCVADHYRTTRKSQRHVSLDLAGNGVGWAEPASAPVEPLLDEQRAVVTLRRLFLRLSSRQREAFDFVDLQGLSAEEAGLRMGLATPTVRVHLHRARQTLRRAMLENEPAITEDRSGLPNRA